MEETAAMSRTTETTRVSSTVSASSFEAIERNPVSEIDLRIEAVKEDLSIGKEDSFRIGIT
jgi:3-hydroxyacyl-CoA dehydrogenase